ncbi:MAG TPA: TonB-dependent receptor [Rhizomicrobium sp.]
MSVRSRRYGKPGLIAHLMIGTAVSALAIGSIQAQAQVKEDVEAVVVTGTSIRGVAPTGTNLITVDRAAIENTGAQNVQQLLSTVPQMNTFGGSGQGGSNSDFSGGFSPAIHGIGGGSSSATLVLINGHRFPTQGLTEAQADPTILPASVLERVEVLPDGASSVYGSDAVAGVVNFITRKDFTGMEFNVQGGFADGYNTFTSSALLGHAWTGGSVMVAYDYSSQSSLMFGSRDYMTTRQDIRLGLTNPSRFTGIPANAPVGSMTTTPVTGPGTTVPGGLTIPYPTAGYNFQDFACPVASVSTGASASAYYYQPGGGYGGPAYSTSTSGVPSQGACDRSSDASILPSTVRNSGLMQVRQELTDHLFFDLEAVYGSRATNASQARGTIAGVAYGPTSAAANASQRNPFYVGNAATGTGSEYIRYDFDQLLGPGAFTKQLSTNYFVSSGLTWDLGGDREFVVSGTAGNNFNSQNISGVVSQGAALLALNGTSNTNGTPNQTAQQDIYGLGTNYPASRVLTTLNALDVWHPAGPGNGTSSQVIASLKDGGSFTNANQGLQDVVAKFDGPIFDLPAGAVKVAVGSEFMHQTMDEYGTKVNVAGPAASNSSEYYYRNGRQVYSAFVEANIPIIGPDAGVPLMQSFSVDVSGRYDKYSDFGDTENPKTAFDWVVTDGLKARGSFGTSFVAPVIHDAQNANSQTAVNALTSQFANPVIPFGTNLPFNGGAGVAGTWVADPANCSAGHGTVVNQSGQTVNPVGGVYGGAFGCKLSFGATNSATTSAALSVPGGNGSLQPAHGRSWSGGFDIDFGRLGLLDGLVVNATYFDVTYRGLITNQQTQNNIPQLTYFAPPGGWTPTSPYVQSFVAGRPITIALPAQIWATFDQRLQNAFNLWENGIDFSVNYKVPTHDMGLFSFGIDGTELLRYSQQGGNTGPVLDTKDGKNSPRYNSQDLMFRANVGWAIDELNVNVAMNYIHPYGISSTNFPFNLPGPDRGYLQGYPAQFTSAGVDHVNALINFDLAVSYALPSGFLGLPDVVSSGTSVSLVMQNVFDQDPPFNSSTSNGYVLGNPIGRLVTLGIRKKL